MSTKKDLEKHIKDAIQKSGFPLEIFTSIILNKHGWSVSPHAYYGESNSVLSNELDIISIRKNRRIQNAKDVLLIECKKQHKDPWVFFRQNEVNSNVFNLVIISSNIDRDSSIYEFFKNYFSSHYYFGKPLCTYYLPIALSEKNEKRMMTKNPIYKSITQIISALKFYTNQEHMFLRSLHSEEIVFYYPIIVFDGDLFSAIIDENGDITLNEENHVQLKIRIEYDRPVVKRVIDKRGIFRSRVIIIDIVKKNYLDEFLKNFD